MPSHFRIYRAASLALFFASYILFSLQQSNDPCTQLQKMYNDTWFGADYYTNLPPKTVNECLKSIPFNKEFSTDSVTNLKKISVLHSAQIYYYDPPTPELSLKPFRLNDSLDAILEKAEKEEYPDNYSFLLDLYKLYNGFHDGHTVFRPACLNSQVNFKHDFHVISLAENFNSTPEIYHVVHPAHSGVGLPVLEEKIVKINGKPAVDYLLDMIEYDNIRYSYADPDAKWNVLMYNLPAGEESKGAFSTHWLWGDHEDLAIEWPNGTTTNVTWRANISPDFSKHISSTQALRDYCFYNDIEIDRLNKGLDLNGSIADNSGLFSRATTTSISNASVTTPASPPPAGYPTPVAYIENYNLSIYYLSETPTRAKTAVLDVKTFDVDDFSTWKDFLQRQIPALKSDGVKKLVIDVANNRGGRRGLPNDIIKRFFPANKVKLMNCNMRWSPIYTWDMTMSDLEFFWDVDGRDFASVQDFSGPYFEDGDTFTRTYKMDYAKLDQMEYDIGANYTGENPFNAEDIIVVSNSLCASACHAFVEGLVQQGVRAYALGGRIGADFTHMQAVGGVKGGMVTEMVDIVSLNRPNDTALASQFPNCPRVRAAMTLNLENKFREGVHLPLEFVYTPACKKLPYTKTMFRNVTNVWTEVAGFAWDAQGAATACDEYTPKSKISAASGGLR
ncbi:hypothetical protein RUND412_008631 [Rhizina undulata]